MIIAFLVWIFGIIITSGTIAYLKGKGNATVINWKLNDNHDIIFVSMLWPLFPISTFIMFFSKKVIKMLNFFEDLGRKNKY